MSTSASGVGAGTPMTSEDLGDGTVNRVLKAGGPRETLASGQFGPYCLAVDDDALYWTATTSVMKLAK